MQTDGQAEKGRRTHVTNLNVTFRDYATRLEVFKIDLYAEFVNVCDYCDILIFVINQFMHKPLFYNKFIIHLYMFRTLCTHHQEVNILLYGIWYYHTSGWASD